MLVRRFARPMFAAVFVAEGMDALREPRPHAHRAEAAWAALASRTSLPTAPSSAQVRAAVRLHGAAMAVAGLMLALGRAPRTAALALAALSLPLAVVNQPFGRAGREAAVGAEQEGSRGLRSRVSRPIGATGGVTGTVPTGGTDRRAQRDRFLRTLSMAGGALLVAADTEGRPGITWRVRHARVDNAAAREARRAVAAAARQAKAAARDVARRS